MVDDFNFRVTCLHDFTCPEAHFSQVSSCALYEFFGFFSPLLFHFRDVRHKVRNHIGRDIPANWLNYVQDPNLHPLCPKLFGNCSHCDL